MASGQVYSISDTPEFGCLVTKDGVAWDLSAAVVTLWLHRPDGTVVSRTATVTDAAAGAARYACATTDLDQAGAWLRTWQVVDGSVRLRFARAFSFTVVNAP